MQRRRTSSIATHSGPEDHPTPRSDAQQAAREQDRFGPQRGGPSVNLRAAKLTPLGVLQERDAATVSRGSGSHSRFPSRGGESQLMSRISAQHHQRVSGHHAAAARPDEDGIDVELLEAGAERGRHLRHGNQRLRQRLLVGRRLAAVALEQLGRAQFRDHVARGLDAEGRHAIGHVLQHLGEDAAQPQRHHRPEARVVDDADQRLEARRHLRHQHAVDGRAGHVLPSVVDDEPRRLGKPLVRHAELHAAGFRLVRHVA